MLSGVFVKGVRQAIAPGTSCQVTTDGFRPYKAAIANTLGDVADYAMLIKVYQAAPQERRYSPAEVPAWRWSQLWGKPIPNAFARRLWSDPIFRFGWAPAD
jgi:hypothetical protein